MRRCISLLLMLLLVACGSVAAPTTVPEFNSAALPADASPTIRPIASPTASPTLSPIQAPTPSPTIVASPVANNDAALLEIAPPIQTFALKPALAADASVPDLPRYTMQITADPAAGTFSGSQIITYTNTTGATLPDLVLRSYVNFPPDVMGDGGTTVMNLTAASLDGVALVVGREAQRTAFRIGLPKPLPNGEQITFRTTFAGTLEPWDDGTWPFLSAYPLLAQWDGAAWRADVTRFPDHVFAQAALYDVAVTLPNPLQVFATGSPITSSSNGKTTTTRFVSGPVREWAASFGRFESINATTNGITVSVYQAVGAGFDLARLRDVALGSLASYERRFGQYPYRELDVHAMTWDSDAGIEYPGFTLILINRQVNSRTDFVVAHEVAHQWWFAVVGNDIYREPWLDEALANYSAIIAAEDALGAAVARDFYASEIRKPYETGRTNGDVPVGLAISDYPSFNAYYRAVYGKGGVFLATLRAELGDDAFFSAMQAYYETNRHRVANRAAFQSAMETAANRSLDAFFNQWLGQR